MLPILVCLAFLLVRDRQRDDEGRFQVTPTRAGSPVLIRTDTRTGESWKLELRAGGDRWVPIPAPGAVQPAWETGGDADAPAAGREVPRPLAVDEIKSLANAILGDELSPDIRIWAVGQLAATPDRRATLALIQLLDDVDEPKLVALIREALEQRNDPRAKQALEKWGAKQGDGTP